MRQSQFALAQVARILVFGFTAVGLTASVGVSATLNNTASKEDEVIQEKTINNVVPGTYQYQSDYLMIKDAKGTYRTTYHSRKKEWFCCLSWFSSSEDSSQSKKISNINDDSAQ